MEKGRYFGNFEKKEPKIKIESVHKGSDNC